MDITTSSIDYYQSGQIDLTGPSTLTVSKPSQASNSDDDVILASSRPKKRSGRTKFKETRHPIYRGVRKRNTDRWVCELREPTKQTRIWLGTYPTAEMAARAHDVAALALRGQSACLNFADSVWRLPVPTSLEPKDIRKTAMEAAEAFRPSGSGPGGVAGEGEIDNMEAFDGGFPSEEGIMGMMNTPPENLYDNDEVTGMINTTPEADYYHDQEAMFDMPGLMQDMAHGMMLSPPRSSNANLSWHYDDTTGSELPLWSHSF